MGKIEGGEIRETFPVHMSQKAASGWWLEVYAKKITMKLLTHCLLTPRNLWAVIMKLESNHKAFTKAIILLKLV